jgi:hypothetical protein
MKKLFRWIKKKLEKIDKQFEESLKDLPPETINELFNPPRP